MDDCSQPVARNTLCQDDSEGPNRRKFSPGRLTITALLNLTPSILGEYLALYPTEAEAKTPGLISP